MSAFEDSVLNARFAALAPEPLPGDWNDVLGRAGTARRRGQRLGSIRASHGRRARPLVVLAAAALVLAMATASAFAVRALLADTGLERRLTPEGVELVLAEVVATGLVDRDLHLSGGQGLYYGMIDLRTGDRRVNVTWGEIGGPFANVEKEPATPEQAAALVRLDERLEDPVSWLPASAWARAEPRPYVPWGYSVCYGGAPGVEGLSQVLALLPPRAADLLRSRDRRRNTASPARVYWCSDFTNREARVLSRIFDDAGLRGHEDVYGLTYGVVGREPGTGEFLLTFTPLYPDEAEGGGIR